MAEPNNEDFLDDIDSAEAEEFAEEFAEIDEDALTLEGVIAERDQFRDRFMRALADAENARKRSDKDRREAENYGGSKLARDLLSVYDNMKRALDTATDEQREVSAADPQQHQAMFEAPLPGTKAGDIIQVAAEGFMLHDRLLRPAQVGVSSTPG